LSDIDQGLPIEPNYFTCNHRAVYEISYKLASLCNCSRNYGGSGGRKNILKKPRGVRRITKTDVGKILVSNEGVPSPIGKGISENPIEDS
jgi:hypothetical protein